MEKAKKPSRHFFRVLTLLFIGFLIIIVAMQTGYYESKTQEKITLTAEKMEQFEKDIAEGKEVDINNYLDNETIDYNSAFSKLGANISKGTEKVMTSGIKEFFKFLGSLFS